MSMEIDSINAYFEKQRKSKSGGYSSHMKYIVKKTDKTFELCVESNKDVWKLADPWGFAAFDYAKRKLNVPLSLRFSMRYPLNKLEEQHSEAFKRRLSYLADVNKLRITLNIGGQGAPLYKMSELAKRQDEVLRDKIVPRKDYNDSGKLEKDLQAFLIGMRLPKDKRTNERLALFGEDFVGNQNPRVVREFPTGVFRKDVSKTTRILPSEYIDFVTINKHGEIAIIELKFCTNPQLEVIAQLLNYILFFYLYITDNNLTSLLAEHLECEPANAGIKAYLVSNVFHIKLADIWPYYFKNGFCMPNKRQIKVQQVKLGYYIQNN